MRNRVDTFIILIKVHCWSSIKRPFCAWRYHNCKNQRRRMPSSHCQRCFVPVLVSRFKSSSRYSWLECKVNPDGGSNQDSVHNPKLTCLRSQYRWCNRSLPCSYMISSFWHKKCAGLGVGRGRTCKPRVSAVRPSCHPRTAVNTLFFGYRVLLNLPKTYSTAIELTIELFFHIFSHGRIRSKETCVQTISQWIHSHESHLPHDTPKQSWARALKKVSYKAFVFSVFSRNRD